jgi:hypothetical protein
VPRTIAPPASTSTAAAIANCGDDEPVAGSAVDRGRVVAVVPPPAATVVVGAPSTVGVVSAGGAVVVVVVVVDVGVVGATMSRRAVSKFPAFVPTSPCQGVPITAVAGTFTVAVIVACCPMVGAPQIHDTVTPSFVHERLSLFVNDVMTPAPPPTTLTRSENAAATMFDWYAPVRVTVSPGAADDGVHVAVADRSPTPATAGEATVTASPAAVAIATTARRIVFTPTSL